MSDQTEDGTDIKMAKTQREAQAQGAIRFFNSGTFSDLIITCKGQEWRVHKTQVCAQSEFFYKACTAKFKEAEENKIALDDDDPQAVEALLRYMYHGTYGDAGNATTDIPAIILDVKMFLIADKYFVTPLKSFVCDKFKEHCETAWNTADFAQAVQDLYSSGVEDTSMNQIAVEAVQKSWKELLAKKEDYPDIHKAIREIPAFGADILTQLTAAGPCLGQDVPDHSDTVKLQPEYKQTFICPDCHSTFTIKIPVGVSTSFSCPMGHRHGYAYTAWARYRI